MLGPSIVPAPVGPLLLVESGQSEKVIQWRIIYQYHILWNVYTDMYGVSGSKVSTQLPPCAGPGHNRHCHRPPLVTQGVTHPGSDTPTDAPDDDGDGPFDDTGVDLLKTEMGPSSSLAHRPRRVYLVQLGIVSPRGSSRSPSTSPRNRGRGAPRSVRSRGPSSPASSWYSRSVCSSSRSVRGTGTQHEKSPRTIGEDSGRGNAQYSATVWKVPSATASVTASRSGFGTSPGYFRRK